MCVPPWILGLACDLANEKCRTHSLFASTKFVEPCSPSSMALPRPNKLCVSQRPKPPEPEVMRQGAVKVVRWGTELWDYQDYQLMLNPGVQDQQAVLAEM